jgi:hypothetical protein
VLRRTLGVALAAIGVTGFAAASAVAAPIQFGACDDATLSQPFAEYGDLAQYKLVTGGDFEDAAPGWAFAGGAALVAGGHGGQTAVALPSGATVTAPPTCVNAAYPKLRFFARGSGGLLRVDLLYRDGPLRLIAVPAGVVMAGDDWAPSRPMATLAIAGGVLTGGEATVALRFTAVRGDWAIDDVFVDPYRRG